jgi:hypothetical protein
MYENYPHGRPIVKKINEIIREKILPLLQEGQANGSLKKGDQESILSALIVMTNFLNLDWIRRIEEEQGNIIIKQVLEIIMNGIRRNSTYA